MKQNGNNPSRRGFILGMLTAAGASTASVMVTGKSEAKDVKVRGTGTSSDPILYRRTEEVERYYSTLYT